MSPASVTKISKAHQQGYPTASDDAWGTNPICMECNRPWPCDVTVLLGEVRGEAEHLIAQAQDHATQFDSFSLGISAGYALAANRLLDVLGKPRI